MRSARAVAVGAEIICVNRPEQRIVGIRICFTPLLQQLKSCLDTRGGQLEMIGQHVAIGTGASVRVDAWQIPIGKRLEAAMHRVARLAAAVGGRVRWESGRPILGCG